MPDTETLTEEQLKEIETRRERIHDKNNTLKLAEAAIVINQDVPALCRSLRAAWARIDALLADRKTEMERESKLVTSLEEMIVTLRTQNQTQAESITYFQENEKSLKAQLVQAEQERTRVINACTEKAAEWDRASWLGDEYAAAKRDALLELAKNLENL